MKNLFLAICFLTFSALSFAGGHETRSMMSSEKRLNINIQQQLNYPSFLTEKPGEHTAELHFKVNTDGSIAVKDIICSDQELKENVMEQVRSFSVNTDGLDLKDSYKVIFRFNTL